MLSRWATNLWGNLLKGWMTSIRSPSGIVADAKRVNRIEGGKSSHLPGAPVLSKSPGENNRRIRMRSRDTSVTRNPGLQKQGAIGQ
jgi:hypothetical protein